MRVATIGRLLAIALIAIALLAPGTRAEAQAVRTWVSGVGDDANPCSRTAPCKTFAGAISKTADGGEIDALDAGDFGTVTITKNLTLDGRTALASIQASAANGIYVNAPSTATVIIRNLALNGISSGLNGVRIIGARDVRVENCAIFGWTQRGIVDERSSGRLLVANTRVSENAQTGIILLPSGTSSLVASLDRVHADGNGNAGIAMTGGTLSAVDSTASGNVWHGIYAEGSMSPSQVTLDRTVAAFNGNGITALYGATVRAGNTTVTGNSIGLLIAQGVVYTYGTNVIGGNGSGNDGATPLRTR